jgi:hypothetical protein
VTPVLTSSEAKRLDVLEAVIKEGQRQFVQVGLALAEVKAGKLYRAGFKTFEQYCRQRWGWTRNRAYELISSANVAKSLPEKCNQKITNENQAAALAKVEPEHRAAVVETAAANAQAENRSMTAAHIKSAAQVVAPFFQQIRPHVSDDSRELTQLKYFWGRACRSDRAEFMDWANGGQRHAVVDVESKREAA